SSPLTTALAVKPSGAVTPGATAGNTPCVTPSASETARKRRRTTVTTATDHGIRSVATPGVPCGRSALLFGGQMQAAGEILEPLLRRSEEALSSLGARGVGVRRVLDDVARPAMKLVGQ